MAALKFVVALALVACAFAAEEERVKKDVLLGTLPLAYSAYPHAYAQYPTYYDDGKYYPGKYEKSALIAPALHATPALHAAPALHAPVVSTYSALPALAGAHPYNYGYPSAYGAYPYYKSYVY